MSRPDAPYARRLASTAELCPDCEVVCYRLGPDLHDFSPSLVPWNLMPDDLVRRCWMTHGIGVANGGVHRCPPTFATLTPITDPQPHSEEEQSCP